MIKLLLIDCDGIIFPNKIYGKDGLCIGKSAKDLDFTAIKRFQAAGVSVEAITGDSWNAAILENRNIPYILSRGKNKEDFLPEICDRYNVSPSDVAYIGDDIFDIGLLQRVGFPFAPFDATKDVFRMTDALKLLSKGGDNVLDELFYYLRDSSLIRHLSFEEEYKKILQLDDRQKF